MEYRRKMYHFIVKSPSLGRRHDVGQRHTHTLSSKTMRNAILCLDFTVVLFHLFVGRCDEDDDKNVQTIQKFF